MPVLLEYCLGALTLVPLLLFSTKDYKLSLTLTVKKRLALINL